MTINGHAVRLEGLIIKRADATGPLPIALVTHGKAPNLQNMLDMHPDFYLAQARDLASRGWLAAVVVRRGFGQSDGPTAVSLSCSSKSLVEGFAADADDLQATLELLSHRPDADPKRMIVVGVSAGGAAVVALGARNPDNLMGVINFSGGLRFSSCPKDDELVAAFKTFGATSRVPALWMYAKNDSFFSPDLVERMRTAFLDGGGDAKLVMFDPIGNDGHALFSLAAGRAAWLPEMDAFLRVRKLPTWQREDVDAALKRAGGQESNRSFFERFIAAPLYKAMAKASGPEHYFTSTWASKSLADARKSALNACQKHSPKEQCTIVMENDDRLDVDEPSPPAPD